MKNEEFDELDEFIHRSVSHSNSLPPGFAEKVSNLMLARHHRKEDRLLYAWGLLYFCLALAGASGLSLLISVPMAISLLQTLLAYKAALIFGVAVFAGYYFLEKRMIKA